MNAVNHAAREHAPLSPSKAAMWLTCPAWVYLAADLPGSPSGAAAKEGTRLHELAEQHWHAGTTPEGDDAEFILPHLNYMRELSTWYPEGKWLIEERVVVVKDIIWGSCDAILVDFDSKTLVVIDLKTGTGHIVSPVQNLQLGIYALAAAHTHGIDLNQGWTVMLAISQAAGEGHDGTQDWVAPLAWLEELNRQAQDAADAYAHRQYHVRPPTIAGDHCLWCPAKATCPAHANMAAEVFPLELDGEIKPAPLTTTLTEKQIARVLELAPMIRDWLKAVEALAHVSPPRGWKLVEGRSVRKITDEAGYAAFLAERGIDAYEQSALPLGKAEKALGKAKAELEPFLTKPPGKPALVPADDPRPVYNPFPLEQQGD